MVTDNLANPYPGLRAYSLYEEELFFGRTEEKEILLSLTLSDGFIAVTGLPGSGKSSLAVCGVAGTLVNKREWRVIVVKPGDDPTESLIDALAAVDDTGSPEQKKEIIREMISGDCNLSELAEAAGIDKEKRLLIVADQFEEIFSDAVRERNGKISGSAIRLVSLLTGEAEKVEGNITVMIVIGSQYLGECARFQGLTTLINRHSYFVAPLADEALKEAITGPALVSGTEVDITLVNILAEECKLSGAPLPVLQHLLNRMWAFRAISGREGIISTEHYETAGTLSGALSIHAGELLGSLDSSSKRICEIFFKCVTGKGYDGKYLSRPEKVSVICGIAGCSVSEMENALSPFRDRSSSFIWPGEQVVLADDTLMGITYPGLSEVWKHLADWIEEEADAARTYLDLSRMSELFHSGAAGLLRGGDLLRMIEWREKYSPALEWARRYDPAWERAIVYLVSSENEYSVADQSRERIQGRRMKKIKYAASLLGFFAVASAAAMTWSVWKGNKIEKENRVAVELAFNAVVAEQEALSAAGDAEEMVEEVNSQLEVMSRVAEESELNSLKLETAMQIAQSETEKALDMAGKAIFNELETLEENRIIAAKRMISVARSMAVRSILMTGQGDVSVLLAYQAYLFNKRNDGQINDPDIFSSLYEVAKIYPGRGFTSFDTLNHGITSLAVPGAGRLYYASSITGGVVSWSRNNNIVNGLAATDDIITCISSDFSGRSLACGTERSVVLLIPTDGGAITEFAGHTGRISQVLWSPDSRYIYSSDANGKIIRWDAESHDYTVLAEEKEGILSMDISPSGEKLAFSAGNGFCSVGASNDTGRQVEKFDAGENITTLRFRDDNIIALGLENGSVEFMFVNGATSAGRMICHSAPVTSLIVNREYDQMITAGADSLIRMWNLNDPSQLPVEIDDFNGLVSSMAYGQDGRSFFAASIAGESPLREMPAQAAYIAEGLCGVLTRNFTPDEWNRYVGPDIRYEETCSQSDLRIRVREIKGE
ncbi:MAG: hypothetical protein LC649_06090 [Bacteroidales bacterium]|nr:hypothetical protein [Bacteroidales bacterium]